jgi:hypothetical protein
MESIVGRKGMTSFESDDVMGKVKASSVGRMSREDCLGRGKEEEPAAQSVVSEPMTKGMSSQHGLKDLNDAIIDPSSHHWDLLCSMRQ